ncbi:MAG: ATP-binding cassette domain-containing protein [Acidobacteriota bacterium]
MTDPNDDDRSETTMTNAGAPMTIVVEIDHALERIHLDVQMALHGGLTALLGPSGSGKTRVLDAIAGFLRPAQARIVLNDEVLVDTARGVWTPPHKRRIGYVFQDSRLFPHLTVRQNLAFGRWFSRRPETLADADQTAPVSFPEIVELLGLGPLLSRHTARLSGGERRRVALGRALLSNPRLLLLDEPLGSLEVTKRQEILPYLDRLLADRRLPMIYVTHEWDEIRNRAGQIVMIEHGRARTGS